MKRIKNYVAVALAFTFTAFPAQAALGPAEIPAVFEKLVSSPTLSNPAMIVIDGSTGQTIYAKNIYAQRKPASVIKILTGAMVLQYLDPLAVFTTTVTIAPETNTLFIRGSLDPWISTNHTEARKMKRASLSHIASNSTNAVKQANAGALTNYTVVYSGLYAQDVKNLKAYWAKRGFKPKFKSSTDAQISAEITNPVVTETSPPVSKILNWMMLWSDNQLAERLARLSARAAGQPFGILGAENIFRKLLAEYEIDASKLVVKDASGNVSSVTTISLTTSAVVTSGGGSGGGGGEGACCGRGRARHGLNCRLRPYSFLCSWRGLDLLRGREWGGREGCRCPSS